MNSKEYFEISSLKKRDKLRIAAWQAHYMLADKVYMDGEIIKDVEKGIESMVFITHPIHEKMWIEESKTQYLTAVQERILCAAIWWDDGVVRSHMPRNIDSGIVVCGWRHHNCFAVASWGFPNREYLKLQDIQGFLTNLDRFVDRKEAFVIAEKANQINQEELKKFNNRKELYSEHIY